MVAVLSYLKSIFFIKDFPQISGSIANPAALELYVTKRLYPIEPAVYTVMSSRLWLMCSFILVYRYQIPPEGRQRVHRPCRALRGGVARERLQQRAGLDDPIHEAQPRARQPAQGTLCAAGHTRKHRRGTTMTHTISSTSPMATLSRDSHGTLHFAWYSSHHRRRARIRKPSRWKKRAPLLPAALLRATRRAPPLRLSLLARARLELQAPALQHRLHPLPRNIVSSITNFSSAFAVLMS